ncbi:phosphoribosylglycinamide formyltransferase [Campylobacter sp. 19-13652]|uniref:phosphoribosylglycinamide formyltransferase n=1 Tax=Campylobacter sp. 19-13652 TaxID=2840180 RepID=UPI001C76A9CC|nr:phosphoribosylglycinamide formyltransferase [Campylobacter sp. 19-13652]BCX78655.1 phosphoribosylglycinamide formyltransferase [Campylobacter sp. 19-13652]
MFSKKIAILFSGSGSNLKAILEKVHGREFNGVKIECVCAITNNPNALGIQKARAFGIEAVVINHKDFASREEFDVALVKKLGEFSPDLTVLAGFMRILSPVFTNAVKAINLHPSILPLFKGAHAIKESFNSDMQVGGVSVHWVSAELDGGKIIAQRAFEREQGMNLEAWEEKIHEIEHEILPQSIINLLSKKF